MTSPRRKRAARSIDAPRVIAYLRVSTEQQAESGAGLAAQRFAIETYCAGRGWTDVEYVTDPALSAKDLNRPELDAALRHLADGTKDVLIAQKLDRVSRSVHDFSGLLARSEREGWRLVLLDIGVDTSTPAGELVATNIAGVAQYERRIISQRTKDALAAKRAAGVRLGRPPELLERVVRRIVDERAGGSTLRAIAEGLTADGELTARGGLAWSTSTVQAVLAGQEGARLRWIAAHEVADDGSGRTGVVHAYDLVTHALAHPIDAGYKPRDGLLWREPLPGERCAECVQVVRAPVPASA